MAQAKSPEWGDQPSALIMAHPGHELLVHHWLERSRPLVFILTDGSGGAETNRLNYSRRLLEACGATVGPAFGLAPDKVWYNSILSHDSTLIDDAIGAIGDACRRAGVTAIACDPIELFNPVHDLANAIGHAVARTLLRNGAEAPVWTYPIEHFAVHDENRRLELDEAAVARKLKAVDAYVPLAPERARYDEQVRLRYELIMRDTPMFAWPDALSEEPYYERFGRKRLSESRYHELITYAGHVRPLVAQALALNAAA